MVIITSADPDQRGCQLSLKSSVPVARVYDELTRRGVAVSMVYDWVARLLMGWRASIHKIWEVGGGGGVQQAESRGRVIDKLPRRGVGTVPWALPIHVVRVVQLKVSGPYP